MSLYPKMEKKINKQREEAAEFRKIFHDPRGDILYGNSMGLSEEEKARRELQEEKLATEVMEALARGEAELKDALYPTMRKEPLPQKEIKKGNRIYSKTWTDTHNGEIAGFAEFMESYRETGDLYLAWKSGHDDDSGFGDFLQLLDGE